MRSTSRQERMKPRENILPFDRKEVLRRAEQYRVRGRIRKAIRAYEEILAVDPRDTDVHIRIAPLYIRTRRREQAKGSLRQASAWYERQGFVEKAIAALRMILAIDRRDLSAYVHLADLQLGRGHKGDALNLLSRARRAFRRRKYRDEALKIEEKIFGVTPDDFQVQISLVRLLWGAGRRRDAIDRLRKMEREWSHKGNRHHWRKTRSYLFRLTPSRSTGWSYLLSLLSSPPSYGFLR